MTVGSLGVTVAALGGLLACEGTLPPLRGQMEVGRDAYAVFVAGKGIAGGDLFAVRTEGGVAVPITFSNVGEMRPALSPDGGAVAFLRGQSLRDSTPGTAWVMNLLSGADRELALPRGAGLPTRVGWSRDGRSIVVGTATALYQFGAPPAPPDPHLVPPTERAAAESSLAILLGEPAFTRVVPCREPDALCILGDTGAPSLLAQGARDAARWGTDSVAYITGNAIDVRPLGPGRARRLQVSGAGGPLRQLTVFTGRPSP
jgi:hypothetical protein